MEIKSISTITTGKGVFECQHALIKTEDNQEFIYRFEFSKTWVDLADYFDNVKSDFKNEYDIDNFGEDADFGLFIKKELWV